MFKRKIYDYLKAWKEESDGMSAAMVEDPGIFQWNLQAIISTNRKCIADLI